MDEDNRISDDPEVDNKRLSSLRVCLVYIVKWRMHMHRRLRSNADLLSAYSSIVVLLLVPVSVVAGIVGFMQLKDTLQKPDAILHFSRPEEVVFVIRNPSVKLVREARYQMVLFNFGVATADGEPFPLSIPVDTVDFVLPGRGVGPWTIRSVAIGGGSIKNGHHLFGHALVQCPYCETVREYWVFVEVGKKGWYAEIDTGEFRALTELSAVLLSSSDYLQEIQKLVPPDKRVDM